MILEAHLRDFNSTLAQYFSWDLLHIFTQSTATAQMTILSCRSSKLKSQSKPARLFLPNSFAPTEAPCSCSRSRNFAAPTTSLGFFRRFERSILKWYWYRLLDGDQLPNRDTLPGFELTISLPKSRTYKTGSKASARTPKLLFANSLSVLSLFVTVHFQLHPRISLAPQHTPQC